MLTAYARDGSIRLAPADVGADVAEQSVKKRKDGSVIVSAPLFAFLNLQYSVILCIFITKKYAVAVFFVEN
jgi:hypothetical protein